MKFIDLFAGIGGFRKGMEAAGHECVGFCEFDKFAVASYTAMHLASHEQLDYITTLPMNKRVKEILNEEYRNGEWYAKDICEVNGNTIPRADIYCFGAPCQDFSCAGKMRGLEGDRSSLVREVFRIIREIGEEDKPEWLLYENVKGMLSSNRGFDFLAILLEMDELGYDCEWFLFNSKYHGVPQNRERVYLAGHLRSRGSAKIFPLKGTDGTDSVSINILGHHKSYRRNTQIFDPDGVTETLSTCQGGGREHYTVLPIRVGSQNTVKGEMDTALTVLATDYKGIAGRNQDNNAVAIPIITDGFNTMEDGTCRTLKYQYQKNSLTNFTMKGDRGASAAYTVIPKSEQVVIPVLTPERGEKRQNGRRFKENGDDSFTLTAQDRHGVAISIDPEVIGGIGEKNFGKQFRQGNRVYDGTKVGCALNSQPVGNAGGQSYLYSLPVDMSGDHASEGGDIARCLNANDQRKVFGANQTRTMAGVLVDGDADEKNGLYVEIADGVVVYAIWYPKYECYIAIRRLTPRECFRLQGWSDEYFERAALVSSDSQLYKQAGNGVTVSVAEVIGNAIRETEVR